MIIRIKKRRERNRMRTRKRKEGGKKDEEGR